MAVPRHLVFLLITSISYKILTAMEKIQHNINHNLVFNANERAAAAASLFGKTVFIKLELSSHNNLKKSPVLNFPDDKQQQNCK
jgi:hypothetical protein